MRPFSIFILILLVEQASVESNANINKRTATHFTSFNQSILQLYLDAKVETPPVFNNVQNLPKQQAGNTIRLQLFVPEVAGQLTHGYEIELALPGKMFFDHIGSLSGTNWTGSSLFSGISTPILSALFIPAFVVPDNGYLGQVDLQVTRSLASGSTLIVKTASIAGPGTQQTPLDVSQAVISFTSFPGDFDEDFDIDFADFLLFIGVFGLTSLDAGYNALMDLDSSGVINLADFLAFVEIYGTIYSPPPATDRDVLVALYYATNGADWWNKTNWLSDNDLSTWYGVGVSNERVTYLNLEKNNLTGMIPAALGGLSDINTLMLAWNKLSGSIPPELGNLSNLTILTLAQNQLRGSIPSELGNLSNLRLLHLSDNQLTGSIPPTLGNLSNLNSLYLQHNQLSGPIPSTLGNLSQLEHLFLPINKLSGPIPPELSNLSNLRRLNLGTNQLSGPVPPELGNLSNLTFLHLDTNQLSGPVPPELGNLSNLTELWLYQTSFTGSLPQTLTALRYLNSLLFHDTELCAPLDPAFQTWLQSIRRWSGNNCQ